VLLNVHELGDPSGTPLVCLHGLSGHGRRYVRLATRLPGHRLICPDMRGHGRSGVEPPWTTEQFVADVLESVPVERADWLGFSFGCRIAAAVAAAAPERVDRLILLDPAMNLPPKIALEYADWAREEESWDTEDEFVDTVLGAGRLFHTPREMIEEEAREHLERGPDGRLRERYSLSMGVAAFSEMAREAPPLDPDRPTLVVTSDRSWIPPHARGTVEEVVPGGHSVLWDAFEQTADAVRRFLDSPAR
jgi:lipase